MPYHPPKRKSERSKIPTEKAAALKAAPASKKEDDEEEGAVPYSRKAAYHTRLKDILSDGSMDPLTVQLKDLYDLHPEYKQYNNSSMRSAFNFVRAEFNTPRAKVEDTKGGYR
jgi:hypothetical protein